jgi:FAD/FMN-containing dehydrogenase/Fe-S oxidoreductase
MSVQTRAPGRSATIQVARRVDRRFRGGMASVDSVDVAALERDLRRNVSGEVRFDTASKGLYATDSSNFRQVPIGVVIPKTIDDVVVTHEAARRHHAPILCRGAGTSLSGETVNTAVVIDFSKYLNRILDVDPGSRLVRVEPGAINEEVNQHAGKHGLIFGPDPSTHAYCTIGGNVGNNSCGVHSVQAQFEGEGGRTSDNTHELEILTYEGTRLRVGSTPESELDSIIRAGGRRGEIYAALRRLRDEHGDEIRRRFVNIPRRVSGYNLDELLPEKGFHVARALVGTEGTCVTVLEATLHLVPNPQARTLLVVGYEDIFHCGDHIPQIMAQRPIGCEALDELLILHQREEGMNADELKILPQGRGWLLVEFGGQTTEESDAKARKMIEQLEREKDRPVSFKIIDDPADEKKLWTVREGGLGATAFPPDSKVGHWPGWEDAAVPPEKVGPYLRDLKALYGKYGYEAAIYGHLGQGCIHSRIPFELRTVAGVRAYRSFLEEAADLVVSYGGSLSGEHGDGQQRAELLVKQYGEEIIDAFREFKGVWDPEWKMNPGKVVDPYRLDENLKLGPDYNPWRPKVKFAYRQDGGDFAHASLRCVGVGKCRIPEGVDVMCPSYMATREEKHTTRGRARLLFEMLNGEVVGDRWRSKEVYEALDLCLACKGCTNDCPVNVDMPTLKAEFLHHHWKGRLRPRYAYAFGFIDQASRLASRLPGLVNTVAGLPGLSLLVKGAAGMTMHRAIPRFAPLTLQSWFSSRPVANPDGPRVILWPDTFNNHFHTEVGVAAVEVLERAGYRVEMPLGHVCCGRPLYDYGFLNVAERYLHGVLDVLRKDIRSGVPVVGIEPSCLAVFKDELVKLLPHDDDAQRLASQAMHFGEFLRREGIELPRLDRRALVWGHCHHKATGGMKSEHELLRAMGLDVQPLSAGCCGVAGSFGFESGHYDISMSCGEQGLLPAVRDADEQTLIVANGFSCKTQIEHGTQRKALHLAEVIRLAQEHGPGGPGAGPPEAARGARPRPELGRRLARAAVVSAGAGAVAGGAAAMVAAIRGRR